MRLSDNNFGKNFLKVEFGEGIIEEVMVYYYESHRGVYDVVISPFSNNFLYRVNEGAWSRHEVEPIHEAIIRFYDLEV